MWGFYVFQFPFDWLFRHRDSHLQQGADLSKGEALWGEGHFLPYLAMRFLTWQQQDTLNCVYDGLCLYWREATY